MQTPSRASQPSPTRRPSWLALVGVGLACAVAVAGVGTAAATESGEAALAGSSKERTLKDPSIVESSGLALSHYRDSRLWTHNDSGGGSTIFALGKSGKTVAKYELVNASHLDWEGMASAKHDGAKYLFVGDIGDNGQRRSSIFVHRVREPRPGATRHRLHPKTYEFKYPDGAHNAETLMVRPGSMRIYIVTKGKQTSGAIYAAPTSPSAKHVNRLRRVGQAPAGMADGVFLDRDRFVLRGYEGGWLYRRIGAAPTRFPLPIKGESIAKDPHPAHVLVGSEGRYSSIWRVRLP